MDASIFPKIDRQLHIEGLVAFVLIITTLVLVMTRKLMRRQDFSSGHTHRCMPKATNKISWSLRATHRLPSSLHCRTWSSPWPLPCGHPCSFCHLHAVVRFLLYTILSNNEFACQRWITHLGRLSFSAFSIFLKNQTVAKAGWVEQSRHLRRANFLILGLLREG